MYGFAGQALRFAPIPHDHFEWQGMIPGESYFAVFEPRYRSYLKVEPEYDVLRLVNTPAGAATAADERGLYIARPRNGGDVIMFKLVDNPNYNKGVTQGSSLVDEHERMLARQVITDERRFIPLQLTPEEAIAAADELELAARIYATNMPSA